MCITNVRKTFFILNEDRSHLTACPRLTACPQRVRLRWARLCLGSLAATQTKWAQDLSLESLTRVNKICKQRFRKAVD